MAMDSSVTVSIGEESSGVFREIRFVIGESRVTSEAAKPVQVGQTRDFPDGYEVSSTDIARQNEEVIVCQSAVVFRVEKALDIEAIARLVGLEDLRGLAVV